MPYSMLVVFLSAALYAQTPPPLEPNQQADKPPVAAEPGKPDAAKPAESGQSKPDLPAVTTEPGRGMDTLIPRWNVLPVEKTAKPPSSKWKVLPFGKKPAPPGTRWRLLPSGPSGQPAVVLRSLLPGNTFVIPHQRPCAVPLTNVLRPSGTSPQVRRIPIPDAQFHMTEVPLPAPPCDDRK